MKHINQPAPSTIASTDSTGERHIEFRGEQTTYNIVSSSSREGSSTGRMVTVATHALVVVQQTGPPVTLSELRSCTLRDDSLCRSVALPLDEQSADLGLIGWTIDCYEKEITDLTWENAFDRVVTNNHLVVLEGLRTPIEHRGNGYGFTLLDEVIEEALMSVAYAVWMAECFEEPDETRAERSAALCQLYQDRFGAQVVVDQIMVVS